MANMNISPYYDDFDESKKFNRILFRAAYAVQGRELTQSQTIIQNQLRKLGDHTFANGTMVIPGHVSLNRQYSFVKIEDIYDYGSGPVDIPSFDSWISTQPVMVGADSGVKVRVINAVPVEGSDDMALYYEFIGSTSSNSPQFYDGEVIYQDGLQGNSTFETKVIISGTYDPVNPTFASSGFGTISTVEEGVFYIDGFFVTVDKQSLIVSKFTGTPSVRVGLQKYEIFVTSEDDPTLNDNSQGSYNYAAPGADRLKVELKLEYHDLATEVNKSNFIQLQTIDNGVLIQELRQTKYGELRKEFAHRTFDESGHYTVDPFVLTALEHLRDENDVKFKDGTFTLTEGGDESKIVLNLDPGKAYVYGYEFESIAPVNLTADKARDVETTQNNYSDYDISNYVIGHTFAGVAPPIDSLDTVNIHDGTSVIGTCRIRQMAYYGDVGGPTGYKIGLFDIQMAVGSEGKFYTATNLQNSTSGFSCQLYLNVDTNGSGTNDAVGLENSANACPIIQLPNSYVKSLKVGTPATSDTTFTSFQSATGTVSADAITFSFNSADSVPGYSEQDYIIFLDGVLYTPVSADFVITSSTVTINNLAAHNGKTFVVQFSLQLQLGNENVKTLVNDKFVILAADVNRGAGVKNYINYSDVYKVNAVWEIAAGTGAGFDPNSPGGADRDVTGDFYLDDGQRDNYLEIASLELISGRKLTEGTDLWVDIDHFNHTNIDGFCSVDSYSIPYEDIPVYTSSSGAVFPLSDCLDFRPKVADGYPPGSVGRDNAAFTDVGGNSNYFPKDNSPVICDYDYYLPRFDVIVIDPEGSFRLIRGEAGSVPRPPAYPENSMKIYEIEYRPYGINLTYVDPTFIDNKRYTMRDIGSLEERIKNLEYYNTMSLLEQDTAEMNFLDENGLDRFKHGFIVEPFTSHGIGNFLSNDYNCAIDPHRGRMRPRVSEAAIELVSDLKDNTRFTDLSTSVQTEMRDGDGSVGNAIIHDTSLLTMVYTHEKMIDQPYASRKESVNPYMFASFLGTVYFSPGSDFWKDEENKGTYTVNNDAHYSALSAMAKAEQASDGVTWGGWQTDWVGVSTRTKTNSVTVGVKSENVTQAGNFDYRGRDRWMAGPGESHINSKYNVNGASRVVDVTIDRSRNHSTQQQVKVTTERDIRVTKTTLNTTRMTTTKTTNQSKQGVDQSTSWGPKTITASMGNRLVAVNQVPFMRRRSIEIHVKKFRPDTVAYSFFDRTKIKNAWITFNPAYTKSIDILGVPTDHLISDANGEIKFTFNVPIGTFYTGSREMFLTDIDVYGDSVHTRASGTFHSGGINTVSEDVVLSTKTIDFAQERKELNQKRTLKSVNTKVTKSQTTQSELKTIRTSAWIDPLAQSIIIEEDGGCFVTKIDLYFAKVPTNPVPLTFQLREMVNGYPGAKIIPYSDVVVNHADITASDNASVATTIFMEAPVFLKQGVEYALIVMADTIDYELWISHMSVDATATRDKDITTGIEISKQPYLGSLFKSQNASTWTAEQQEDLKFTLYKAKFDIASASNAVFGNVDMPAVELGQYGFFVAAGNKKIRVYQKNHGMPAGSTVTIGLASGVLGTNTIYSVLYSDIAGDHIISNVEFDSFVIDVSASATTFTQTGIVDATDFTLEHGAQIDTFMPIFGTIAPAGAALTWQAKTTTGKSVSGITGEELPWVRDTEFGNIVETSNNFPINTRLVANAATEVDKFTDNGRSMYFKGILTSSNENISPAINTDHMACVCIGNRVDRPETTTETLALLGKELSWVTGTKTLKITHVDHGMVDGAAVVLNGTDLDLELLGSGGTTLNGTYRIEVIDSDSYVVQVPTQLTTWSATNNQKTGGATAATIEWSETHSKFVAETEPMENAAAARYITTKITLEDPAASFVLYLAGIVQRDSDFEIYYRYQTEYDDTPFYQLPWLRVNRHPDQVNLYSNSPNDQKEYKFHLELAAASPQVDPEAMYELPDPFTSIAFKIVDTSKNTTQVPEFNNMRIICLGD